MEKVDLEALDAMHAAAKSVGFVIEGDDLDTAQCGHYLAALHNAYPVMAAELRALREERDTLRAEAESLKAKWKREECAHCDERPGGHLGTIWCAECFNWHCSEAAKERMQSELDAAMAEAARLREAQKENDQLRSLLATSSADCAYCGLPAKRMAECASGFPGCARADDMLFSATPTRDDLLQELAEARAESARLRELIQDWHDNGEFDYRHPREVAIYNTVLASTTTTAEWLEARDEQQRRIGATEAREDSARLEEDRAQWKRQGAEEELRRLAGTHSFRMLDRDDLIDRADKIKARMESTDEA